VRHDACSHDEKIHVVVLNAVAHRVQVVAQTGARPRVLVGRYGSSHGIGTNQHATFDATCVDGRGKSIRYAVVITSTAVIRANIQSCVPLGRKSSSEALLEFESDLVRAKPYPHDYSQG
jgi:hypothetical protein